VGDLDFVDWFGEWQMLQQLEQDRGQLDDRRSQRAGSGAIDRHEPQR